MEKIIASAKERAKWINHTAKVVAVAASSGAALVSIFTALYSYGVIGQSESHQSIGNIGASWVGLRPGLDTATAIGDTVHYAVTVTDKNGSILVGARPIWTTGDSSIATVLQDGSVIARGPGRTMVSVVVGRLVTHSTIVVDQRVARVEVGRASGDSNVVLNEGAQLELRAIPLDARGYPIPGLHAAWHVDDTTVAGLDSSGVVTGKIAGKTLISARINGIPGRTNVSVVTPASAIALVAGSNQRTLGGKTLPQSVVVRATNRRGGPAAGKRISFRLSDGQGGVEPATALTDADGRARTSWTLGTEPGRQTLFASVENVDSALAIVAEADPVAANTRVVALSDALKGQAGEPLTDSVSIRVTDSAGRVLPDVPVTWTAVEGEVGDPSVRTDSLGLATTVWTLGKKTGTQRLRAQVGLSPGLGIPPLTLVAMALSGPPASVAVIAGDKQRGIAGAELAKSLVFKVADENGSGVANAILSLAPSGGVLADTLLTADSVGIARTRWTMGRSAGEYTVTVHVEGIKALLKAVATANTAAAANLAFDDVVEKRSKDSRTRKLFAVVTDVYGNPVPNVRVNFTVKSGTVAPSRAVSDAKGRAALTWRLGSKPGEQTLKGIVRGTDVTGAYVTQVGPREPTVKAASLESGRK